MAPPPPVVREQLPHLLRLIDDPSRRVRRSVLGALEGFGQDLEPALRALEPPLGDDDLAGILDVVAMFRRDHQVGPRFDIGQVVRHRRFGYRALIVACDEQGRSSSERHNEPWYHLLVHGSDGVTAVPQGSLEQDGARAGVRHPMVPRYFRGFQSGRYLRNEEPWEE